MRRWWRKWFPAPPPSAYLFRHLDNEDGGFALDDLTSGHEGDPAYQDVIDEVLDMMERRGDQALAGPAARTDLRRLAMRLASQGR
jgi:hypothetical protein